MYFLLQSANLPFAFLSVFNVFQASGDYLAYMGQKSQLEGHRRTEMRRQKTALSKLKQQKTFNGLFLVFNNTNNNNFHGLELFETHSK